LNEQLSALLIHERSKPFDALCRMLWELSVGTHSIDCCRAARGVISRCKPDVIFTDRSLSDGDWQTVLYLVEQTDAPASVIVVSPVPDAHTYLSVMEGGAFDFVAPPFEREPLNFVLRSAALNTHRLRTALTRVSCA